MYCQKCGKQLPDNAVFCHHCNTAITAQNTTAPAKKAKKSIFKRWWFWAIIIFVVIGSMSSGGSDDPQELQQPSGETSAVQDKVSIEETVLYDEGGVRITVKGIEESFTGLDIKLLVENDTNSNIAVSCSDFVVNGITVHGSLYIDAAAGKKANGEISFYNTNLETAGIGQIATIKSFDAYISDTDTYLKIKDISFEMSTSIAANYIQEVDESGELLFEQDGISVIAKNLTDGILGETVMLLVTNNSGRDLLVQADNVSVNGYTISVLFSDAVCDGTVRFCEMDLLRSTLEENGIDTIEEVTFELVIINPKTYETIMKTGELCVTVAE